MDHRKYVPVLKWKMGEYQALSRLSDKVKDRVVPLLEIPPAGYDFEAKQVKKTPAEQLKDFGKRLFSKWGDRKCYVDLKFFEDSARADGEHCLSHVFHQVSEHECGAVPVISLQSDTSFLKAVAAIDGIEQLGVAIRLSGSDFDETDLAKKVERCASRAGVPWGETDIIIDLCTPEYIPKGVFRAGLTARLAAIPALNKTRSEIVIGTSYPEVLAASKEQEQHIQRKEWLSYKDFVGNLSPRTQIPTFGDYAAAHPSLVELDMRFVTPYAKLRYTLEDSWYVAVGKAVRTAGFEQYQKMCEELIKKEFFDGPEFSAGDEYIYECAKGRVTTGNLSTWVWVATNRHITKTVSDLASFHGFSNKL
jgi:Beta protein